MNELQIRVTATGKYQCYRTELGIDRLDVGPGFDTPREAIRYSDLIAAEHVSPLRDPAEPSPAVGVPPFADGPGVDGSAGARIDVTSGTA